MTVINSNSAADFIIDSLSQNDRSMAKAIELLSSGKRINSAVDDAAGLAIATKMTSQVLGLGQAGRNVNNATSMLQLADDATESVIDILQRMREMVLRAVDGSNSTTDVALINVEFKESAAEIDRIVDSTEFNNKKLISGNAGGSGESKVTFQVGANATQTLTVDFSDLNLAAGDDTGRSSVRSITLDDDAVANYSGGIRLSDGTTMLDLSEDQIQNAATTKGLAALIEASGLYLNVSNSSGQIMLANPLIGDHAGVSAIEISNDIGRDVAGIKAINTLTLNNHQVKNYNGSIQLHDSSKSEILNQADIRNAGTTNGLAALIGAQNMAWDISSTSDTNIVITHNNIGALAVSASKQSEIIGTRGSGTNATNTLTLSNAQVSSFVGTMTLDDGTNDVILSQNDIRNQGTTAALAALINTSVLDVTANRSGNNIVLTSANSNLPVTVTTATPNVNTTAGTAATNTLTLDNAQVSSFVGTMTLNDGAKTVILSQNDIRNQGTTAALATFISTSITNEGLNVTAAISGDDIVLANKSVGTQAAVIVMSPDSTIGTADNGSEATYTFSLTDTDIKDFAGEMTLNDGAKTVTLSQTELDSVNDKVGFLALIRNSISTSLLDVTATISGDDIVLTHKYVGKWAIGVTATAENFEDRKSGIANKVYLELKDNSGVTGYNGNLELDDGTNTVTLTQSEIRKTGSIGGLVNRITHKGLNLASIRQVGSSVVLTSLRSADFATALTTGAEIGNMDIGVGGKPMGDDLSDFTNIGMLAVLDDISGSYKKTLAALDLALEGVVTLRSTFGATMNRLEYASDNLASSKVVTAIARGRIEDTNYASAVTALVRSQIIAEAGTALLAQANLKAQSVLALLRPYESAENNSASPPHESADNNADKDHTFTRTQSLFTFAR